MARKDLVWYSTKAQWNYTVYFRTACRDSRTCQRVSTHNSSPGKQVETYLKLDLRLSDILLATTAVRDLLGLSDLSTDSLSAEVLQGESLDGVDAQGGVGLNNGEATGHCSKAVCKLLFLTD